MAQSPQHAEVFNRCLFDRILLYDFIGNYNYAYLLNELGVEEVTQYVIDKTISVLFESIKGYEYQRGMILSRFLGELYKYDLIKRSFLYYNLEQMLLLEGNELGVINAVCTVLDTCIGYLDTSKKTIAQNHKFRFLYSFKVTFY